MNQRLWEYLRRDKRTIGGWLQRIDAEIIGAILDHQHCHRIRGGCVEIGVHHGKSFIPLCMALAEGELALCIDIFDDQRRNLDGSGRGDLDELRSNLSTFGVDDSCVRIFKGSSEDVSSSYVLEAVGPVRFFSVDGGHWKSIVKSDLRLAAETLATGGVIALDDYCRVEWPDVTSGYALWREETNTDVVPFAAGSNKLFLCRKDAAKQYRAVLGTLFLRQYYSKTYVTEGVEVDCYRQEHALQDETYARAALVSALKTFRPDLYFAILRLLRRHAH